MPGKIMFWGLVGLVAFAKAAEYACLSFGATMIVITLMAFGIISSAMKETRRR